jgi:hypothetical protein
MFCVVGVAGVAAMMILGCAAQPKPAPEPPEPTVETPPVTKIDGRDIAGAQVVVGPDLFLPLDSSFEVEEDHWKGKWTYRAGRPVNITGTIAGSKLNLSTEQMLDQAGPRTVSGSVEVEMIRNKDVVTCSVQIQQSPADGSPPSLSSYIALPEMKLKGDFTDIIDDNWDYPDSMKVPGDWHLFSYKQDGKVHPVKVHVAFSATNAKRANDLRPPRPH